MQILNLSPYWHAQYDVVGCCTILIRASPILAVSRNKLSREPEIDQGIDIAVGQSKHRTAATSITTIGPAKGNIFFASERHNAVAAIAGDNFNARFVDELHAMASTSQSVGQNFTSCESKVIERVLQRIRRFQRDKGATALPVTWQHCAPIKNLL
jgi:hypothetical protein